MIRQDWSTLKKLMFMKTAAGGGAAVEDTATGNPLTFVTDLARPLKSLLIPFTPVQSGTGDPSPQNVRPIVPWNGLKVWSGSGNLCGADIEQGEYNYTYGYKQDSETRIRSDYIPISAGTYTISCTGMQNVIVYVFNKNKIVILEESIRIWQNMPFTFTISGDRYIAFVWRKTSDPQITPSDISNVMLNIGNTAQSYVPYKPITETDISFPSPVYGGTLDVVSGVLTVEWAVIALNGTEANWGNYNQGTAFSVPIIGMTTDNYKTVFCDRFAQIKNITSFGVYASASNDYAYFINATDIEGVTDLASWKAYLAENPMGFAYELATPQEITLTPQQITALVGDNTIWSDADGSMTAVYLKKG